MVVEEVRAPSSEDVVAVASFLAWSRDDMAGGFTTNEAFESFSRLIGVNSDKLRSIVKPIQEIDDEA